MATNRTDLYSIRNDSGKTVYIAVFDAASKFSVPDLQHQGDSNLRSSFDVVLGPGKRLYYDHITNRYPSVPRIQNEADFQSGHIRVQLLNTKTFCIYELAGRVLCAANGDFSATAPVLRGWLQGEPIELVINSDGTLSAEVSLPSTSPLATISWITQRYAIYSVSEVGELWEKAYLTLSWAAKQNRGRPAPARLLGPLATASWAVGRYSIYALAADGLIYERAWLTTQFADWAPLPPPLGGAQFKDLSAVSWALGSWGIYAVSDRGDLLEMWYQREHGGWTMWTSRGRPSAALLTGPVAAVCWTPANYSIYALGDDNNVWELNWTGRWQEWGSIGRPSSTYLVSLTTALWRDHGYHVAGIGQDGCLWLKSYLYTWNDWVSWGQPENLKLIGPVSMVSWGTGDYAYYAIAEDKRIYELFRNKWSPVVI